MLDRKQNYLYSFAGIIIIWRPQQPSETHLNTVYHHSSHFCSLITVLLHNR